LVGDTFLEKAAMSIRISLHQGAREKLDRDTQALIGLVRESPGDKGAPPSFTPDLHVTEIPHEGVHDFQRQTTDATGRTVARHFEVEGRPFMLDADGCSFLAKIADRLCSNRDLRDRISNPFVEELLVAWIQKQLAGNPAPPPFPEYFVSASEAVHQTVVWVPIANLVVQSAFSFGGSEIRPVSKNQVDTWEAAHAEANGASEFAKDFFAKVRKQFQGYAALVMTMEAEEQRAEQHRHRQARGGGIQERFPTPRYGDTQRVSSGGPVFTVPLLACGVHRGTH
jgi:hypothetical protein